VREPGDTVLWRFVEHGHVRHAVAATLVDLDAERVVLWVPAGTETRFTHGPPLRRSDPAPPVERGTWRNSCLRVTPHGAAHSLWLFFGPDGAFGRWYVNLQAPLRETPLGFDTADHALDVVVEPDGAWSLKDEHHLAEAVELGAYSGAEAAAIRREAERVVERWPFPTGWEDWRPPAAWPLPALPAGWDAV
jgi:hypothetical protein